jgi:hypothetical protein
LFIISCSVTDTDSAQNKIVGQWEWISSTGGFIGEKTTRDSAGVPNRHFNFNSDQTFNFYRSDTLIQTGIFSLNKKDGDLVISYNTKDENFFFDQRVSFQGSDTLILADECYDCYINTYIRTQ